jgi:hypothetical protein
MSIAQSGAWLLSLQKTVTASACRCFQFGLGKNRLTLYKRPIATYGSQATLKKGLSKAEIEAHAVIYMVGTSSDAAPGEKIVKNPIAVKPATEDQKLHAKSRINFDKIYTIEHNVRVMNVGKVVVESMHNLVLYFKNTHFA